MNDLLELQLFQNTPLAWSSACAAAGITLSALLFARRMVRIHHQRRAEQNQGDFARIFLQILSNTMTPFIVIVSLYGGSLALTISEHSSRIVSSFMIVVTLLQLGIWMSGAAMAWLEHKRSRSLLENRPITGSLGIIGVVLRSAIWIMVTLLALDNLGVNVTALFAGLGIGGIAVALALQNILGDLFASLSITLDKPFVVGDFLAVGDFLGSVEQIGIKSTRLRSLSGEQIIMPNSDLLSSRVRNYGRMAERRIVFTLNVAYETSASQLEQIPEEIRKIVEAQKNVRFDRSHFATFGAHSIDVETVYYVLSPDYNEYMDIQQEINFGIFKRFAALAIEFAYPTQKLYLARAAASTAHS